jgi:uncharacterized iron-regulated membrane protein
MKRARRWWLYLHLCVGLTLGAVFVLLGVTGSLLVFYPELDRTLNPALRPSAPAVQIVSIQSVAHQLRMLYPERNGGWRIELPLNDGTPITARYAQPTEREGRSFSPLMVTLDPATLKRTSDRVWGDYLVTWIYDLHCWKERSRCYRVIHAAVYTVRSLLVVAIDLAMACSLKASA